MDKLSAAKSLFNKRYQSYDPGYLELIRKANDINYPPPSGKDPGHMERLGVPELRNFIPYIPPERLQGLDLIGKGGFASVYRATIRSADSRGFAFASPHYTKILYMATVVAGPGYYSVMSMIGISNLPGTDKYVIVMEYAEGGNLSEFRLLHRTRNWARRTP
ncbi:hypothetical protein BC936DRAFT_141138 [Jimgerdemannia flammicorona]|uniref:Protein kinase domain-containing protein n=1 Tax=Jimgerdemannia flammicorona TaxID=994334 RepID=A0A433DGC3_9FUNG|nr:hypothetical protein BC936DRAFT_141138 [Jimgerdemannia flammicorona]